MPSLLAPLVYHSLGCPHGHDVVAAVVLVVRAVVDEDENDAVVSTKTKLVLLLPLTDTFVPLTVTGAGVVLPAAVVDVVGAGVVLVVRAHTRSLLHGFDEQCVLMYMYM